MPPKQKITKEMILEATFQITREKGFESVNARSLAKVIGCSTQPIFSQYASMSDLKQAFHGYLGKYFDEYALSRAAKAEDFSREIGRSYIAFARDESNLFQVLFMSECFGLNGFSDMFGDEGNLEAARGVSKKLGISLEAAKNLYMKTWVFLHGIASLIATKSIKLSDEEVEKMHREANEAFRAQEIAKEKAADLEGR
jgi:AcrR family transcriptional regulator